MLPYRLIQGRQFGKCGKMLKSKTYQCTPGQTSITRSELAYIKRVHMVALNGNVRHIITDTSASPEALEVIYNNSVGGLYFDRNIPFESGNTINVVYEV